MLSVVRRSGAAPRYGPPSGIGGVPREESMSTSAPLGPVSSGGVDPDLAAALPADAAQGLASWEAATGRRVFLDRLLTNGFTDAVVAIVLI